MEKINHFLFLEKQPKYATIYLKSPLIILITPQSERLMKDFLENNFVDLALIASVGSAIVLFIAFKFFV